MKIFRRILWTSLILLLVAIAAATGTTYYAVTHPKEVWSFAQNHFLPKDLLIDWGSMTFSAQKLSLTSMTMDWVIEDLRVRKSSPAVDIPIQNLRFNLTVQPFGAGPKIRAHQVSVSAPQEIRIHREESQDSRELSPYQQIDGVLRQVSRVDRWVQIESLAITAERILVQTGTAAPLTAKVSLKKEATDWITIKASLVTRFDKEQSFEVELSGELALNEMGHQKEFLRGRLSEKGMGLEAHQEFSMKLMGETIEISVAGPFSYRQKKLKLAGALTLKASLTSSGALITADLNLSGIPGPLVKIDQAKIKLDLPFQNGLIWSSLPSQFSVSAPVDLFFVDQDMRPPIEKSCHCKIPETLKTSVTGQVWLATALSEPKAQQPLLDVTFRTDSVENKLFTVHLAGSLKAHKRGIEIVYEPTLNSSVVLHSFQGLRQFLDAKNILIPAPLDVLEGTIESQIDGPVLFENAQWVFPLKTAMHLKSQNQKVEIRSESRFNLDEKLTGATLAVRTMIDELQLELPPLDPLRGKPRVTPDHRIQLAPKEKKKASEFKLAVTVEVETTRPDSIRLLSKYFHPYMPLSIKISYSGPAKAPQGLLKLAPFQVEYLKRKMQVERLTLDLNSGDGTGFPIDGRFKIKQTFYTVYIDVSGLSTKPAIHLSSEPYLSESEIISVLLYNRTSDQLASSDAQTASGVNAAVADRAIGLFGLWAFAATPIKSFSYNAATKTYSATVDLPGEVSAAIGTNWEAATSVELRRRVSQQWMLTAKWTPASDDASQSTKLMLEWEKRF